MFQQLSRKIKKCRIFSFPYFHYIILAVIIILQWLYLSDFNKSATQKFNSDVENAIIDIRKDLKVEISFIIGINPSSINWETDEAANIDILWSNLQNVSNRKIQRIIYNRLEQHDIKGNFEYRITGKNIFTSMNSPGFNSSMTSHSFQKALTYDGSYMIFLYIPNKNQLIHKHVLINTAYVFILIFFSFFIIRKMHHEYKTIKTSNQVKTDFINNMTHEFKTPLSTISLTVDFLNNPKVLNNPDRLLESINIIKSENKRMTQQVEKILEAAQYHTTHLELTLVPIHVNTMIERITKIYKHKLNGVNQTIHVHLNAKNDYILVDEVHFSNILHNLLDNAHKYSHPENVHIDIHTSNPQPDRLEIAIEDKGIGMKKEDIKQVFEKFYRASTGNLHNVKGFGLGLNYVKTVIDAHKADIKVESQFGIGSKFTILFNTKNESP